MQELILDHVKYLSIVDDPAVGDAQFLVTKRYEDDETETMTETDNPETDDDDVVMKDAVAELNDQMAAFNDNVSVLNDRIETLESEVGTVDDDSEQDEQSDATEEERYTLAEYQAIADVVGGNVDVAPGSDGDGDGGSPDSAESSDSDAESEESETKRKGKAYDGGDPSTYVKTQSDRKVKDLKGAIEQARSDD